MQVAVDVDVFEETHQAVDQVDLFLHRVVDRALHQPHEVGQLDAVRVLVELVFKRGQSLVVQ